MIKQVKKLFPTLICPAFQMPPSGNYSKKQNPKKKFALFLPRR